MGWKGTLRSIQAASRAAEREARRRQRELAEQRKQLEKMEELEQAAHAVAVYENLLEVLQSVHKQCGPKWDWAIFKSTSPPEKPQSSHTRERAARVQLRDYEPGAIDDLFRRATTKREKLAEAVKKARKADEKEYREAQKAYEQEYEEWQSTTGLASRILSGEPEASIEAIKEIDPFTEISELGSRIQFEVPDSIHMAAALFVNSDEVIPKQVFTLLKSGKLSIKDMPKTKFNELYQDYICGGALRVARELFALLPIEWVIVTALGELLNTQTGHMEQQPILSVAIPRETLEGLNFERLDPSDSMENFVHRMKFSKTNGFNSVEKLSPADLQPT